MLYNLRNYLNKILVLNKKIRNKQLIIIIIVIFLLGWSIKTAIEGNDFDVFMNASIRLRNHENIYLKPYFKNIYQYFYSPLFAIILVPFSFFPFSIFETFWLMFMFYNCFDLWKMFNGYFGGNHLSDRKYNKWLLLTLLLSCTTILYNISQVQMTVFLVWGIFKSIYFFENKGYLKGGSLLALIINIKIMPIIFIPYLLYRNFFKETAITILFFISFLYLPVLFIGWEYNQLLLITWWNTINPINGEHLIETSNLLHSITSTIPVLLTKTEGDLQLRRNILNLSLKNAILISNIFKLILIFCTLSVLKLKPFQREKNKMQIFYELGYICLICPLIFPHQNKYSYFFVIPAFIYLVYYFINQNRNVSIIKISIFIMLTLTYLPLNGSDIIGKHFFDLIQYFRIQVISTFLLVFLYLTCNVKKFNAH